MRCLIVVAKAGLLLASFAAIVFNGFSQNLLDVDYQTYNLFVQGKYDSLKIIGNEYIKRGDDFYFLRMRLGMIYYQEKNYEVAQQHFERAYQFNDADSVLQEYLYFTYLFTNQPESANILLCKSSISLQQKLNYRPSGIRQITIGGGYLTTNNDHNFAAKDILQQNAYAEGYFSGKATFGRLEIQSIHNKRLKMFHVIQCFSTTTLGRTIAPTFHYAQTGNNLNIQYNGMLSYAFNRGWKTYLGAGFYRQTYSLYQFETTNPVSPDTFPKTKVFYQGFWSDCFAGVFGVSKRLPYCAPLLEIAVANFNQKLFLQGETSITYFPLGNTHFYGTTTFTLIKQDSLNQFVISQSIGGKITSKLWYEINGSYGNHQNYLAAMGFLTYNTLGTVRSTTGFDLRYYLNRFIINLLYRFQLREGNYFQVTRENIIQRPNFNFNNHIFSISITWKL